jgi:putative endonuclease
VPGSIPGGPTKDCHNLAIFFSFMDICTYILFSQSLNRFYIGACQESLLERIDKHNTHFYSGKHFTSAAKDWELFLKIHTESYPHAIRLERKIKSMKSSKYIFNLKKYPELIVKIFEETKNS